MELKHPKSSYRFERKFYASRVPVQNVIQLVRIHPFLFQEAFSCRTVNNIYLDTYGSKAYVDNVEGQTTRAKIRIRWYGDLFGFIHKPILEFKLKEGFNCRKEHYKLTPFSLDTNTDVRSIETLINNSDIPEFIKLKTAFIEPVIINSYTRRYYKSLRFPHRITVDNQLHFFRFYRAGNSFSHHVYHPSINIVELKNSVDQDEYTSELCRYLPFRMTKISKYVYGIYSLGLASST